MLQTTTKKCKNKNEVDPQIQAAIDQLQGCDRRSVNNEDFFLRNTNALGKVLRAIVARSQKQKGWKQIFINSLKGCIGSKRHEAVIFHFKVVKQFWRLNYQNAQALLSALDKVYEGYKNSTGKHIFPKLELNEVLIDYNIIRHDDKKFHFVEKTIMLQCQYFVDLADTTDQFFNHYMMYCKAMGIINVFLYSCQAFLKYLNKKGEKHLNKYCPFIIIYEIVQYFHKNPFIDSLNSYIFNTVIYLSGLLKMERYRKILRDFNRNGMGGMIFIEQVVYLIQRIDKSDNYSVIKSLIYSLMYHRQQQGLLKLVDPLQVKLAADLTPLEAYRFYASIHHFIINIKNNIRRSEIEAFCQSTITNLKTILQNRINDSSFLQLLCVEISNTSMDTYSPDIFKINFIQSVENLGSKQMQKFLKWSGYFDLMIQLFQAVSNPKYKEFYKMQLQTKFYMLLAMHLRNNNKSSKVNLMSFFTQQYLPYFGRDIPTPHSYYTQKYSYARVLSVLSNLCFSYEFGELTNRCIYNIIKVIPISSYCEQIVKFGHIFARMVQEKAKEQKGQIYSRRNVFAADTVKVLTHSLIQSLGSFQAMGKVNYWIHYFRAALSAFFYFYQDMDDQSIEDISKEIVKISLNQQHFEQISSVIKQIGLSIIHQPDFNEQKRKRQLQNALIFCQDLHVQIKSQLKIKFKISFIDFCFNLKSDLYNLFNLLDQASIEHKKFIQNVSDRIDEMQTVILDTTAPKFIDSLLQLVNQGVVQDFTNILSITIKSIFYIVYQEKFILKLSERKTNQKKTQMLYQFEEELEESICKLVQVKQKCQGMVHVFRKAYNRLQNLKDIGSIRIKKMEVQWSHHTVAQFNDLMYMAHLCGVLQLKNILLSMRLSLIYQHEANLNVVLLEVSKYIFLKIFNKAQEDTLASLIRLNLQTNQDEQYGGIIRLLLFGQICQRFQNRIFKIFYLLKLNGITFFNTFKEIISYFSYFLFLFPHLPANLQRQKFLIKTTRNTQIMCLSEKQYWIKDCWQQGWILTKLITIVNRKILQTAINTNQLSKIKSFLNFTLLLAVRSAHITELQLPLSIALNKQEPLNVLKIVDSLRKLQAENINKDSYRLIDKMIFSKRYSISMPQQESENRTSQIGRLYSKIQNSFKGCLQTGSLLTSIFCHLASKQLNLNAYQSFYHKNNLQIAQQQPNYELKRFFDQLQKDRSLNEQIELAKYLSNEIVSTIFISHQKATIIKDFISQFIDLSLAEDNLQILSANHHRIIDEIIAKIALTFQSHNYALKKLLQKLPKISIKERRPLEVIELSEAIVREFNESKDKFSESISRQLQELRYSNYPVSLIFPLGKNMFTLSFHSKLLVTFTNRYLLQDKIQQCFEVIAVNDKIVKQNSNTKINYNKRVGLDRQLGKMCELIDVGILDIDFLFINKSILSQYQKIDLNILKFASSQTLDSEKHFHLYVKRFRLHSNSCLESIRSKLKRKEGENENLLLLIHQKYLQFPFELIKAVRQNKKGIYRLPSIQYLLQNQHRPTYYSIKKCKYLVNTQKDLPETQKRFEKLKSKFGQWMGIKGKIPLFVEVHMLLNQQLFLYMGHGTGLQHLKQQQLLSLSPACPMLVFGCSSAKMIFDNSQPFGCAYSLLMKGCPAYMGCLWVVTDVDIDNVTQQIFLHSSEENLSLILDAARKKCSYPNINGGSAVVYGMPVHLKR